MIDHSGISITLEIPTNLSPFSRVINFTPLVDRPMTLIPLTGERTARPQTVDIIISSPSETNIRNCLV